MINFKKPMFSLGFRGLLLLALLAQAACSSHPLMRSATATSTDAADDIVRALDSGPSGATAANAHATVPPPDISAALLPPLAPEADGRNVSMSMHGALKPAPFSSPWSTAPVTT